MVDGQRYRFSVVSVNSIGNSVTATPIGIVAATVPDPPNAPTMISQSQFAINFSWQALDVAKNGGSPVLDYKIYWDKPNDALGYVLLASTTSPAFTYTATDLVAGSEYKFRIVALNIVGDSDMSLPTSIIAATLPGAPSQPSKVDADDTPMIQIAWNPPSYNGGSLV